MESFVNRAQIVTIGPTIFLLYIEEGPWKISFPENSSITTGRNFMKLSIMIGSHVNWCALILGWPLTFPLCTASICVSVFSHKPTYLGTRLTNQAEIIHKCSSWIAQWWCHLQPFLHSIHLFVCFELKLLISRQWFDLSAGNFACVYIWDRVLVHMTGGATYNHFCTVSICLSASVKIIHISVMIWLFGLKFCMCIHFG